MTTAVPVLRRKEPFWLGGLAGAMAVCVTHPMDLTRVRMQVFRSESKTVHPTTLQTMVTAVRTAGYLSLYAGLSASVMRQLTYSTVRVGGYEFMKGQWSGVRQPRMYELVFAAVASGMLGAISGCPADLLVVRMTTDSMKPPKLQHRYRNVFDGLFRIATEEGVSGLVRGIMPNVIRAGFWNASQLVSYDYFKSLYTSPPSELSFLQIDKPVVLHVISSVSSSLISITICNPLDVVKARVMATTQDASALRMLYGSFRAEGPTFLLKGWTPAFLRSAPTATLLFVFMEQLRVLGARFAA
ncbi:mitochondrial carrier [Amylocystis lapponica]|nr:mitochondrial carrier [Amylocystis lapponica]